ncbi:MAG: hypothetical protein WCU00_00625 [Candidatus Latescibacterota bacterium]
MKTKKVLTLLFGISCITCLCIGVVLAGCSKTTGNYDDLEKAGKIEKTVRKKYSGFFRTMKMLADYKASSSGAPDSLLIKKAALATDKVIREVRDFPATVESRLALDALSYAAHDLTVSPGFAQTPISNFWEMALLNPIFTKGREYAKKGIPNTSTQLQIVKSLQRGMGAKATEAMLEEAIPIVGPIPPAEVMDFAAQDTLVFKSIRDLILYSHSVQKIGPPHWMVTGPWFMAVTVEGFLPSFYSIVPILIDRYMFLSFKSFRPADIYEVLYHDPAPADDSQTLTWLAKVRDALDSMKFDNTFADRVKDSGLPVYDTHYLFDNYLVQTAGDSLKKEYYVSFTRREMFQSNLQYSGVDSIAVTFDKDLIKEPTGKVMTLNAYRHQGASMNNGQFLPALSGKGKAYLMELGKHDPSLLEKLKRAWMPKITVNAN